MEMGDYVPQELVTDILLRLPVDDLLRCTSVCKSWYSLITSPDFISLHLKLSIPNQEPAVLVGNIDSGKFKYSIHRDNQAFDEITDLISPAYLGIIGSCNGIFCFSNWYTFRGIILWNPSIRKQLVLTNPPIIRSLSHNDWYIGFGFVPATNDYRVVIISYTDSFVSTRFVNPPKVVIYELSTNSWRSLDNAVDFPYVMYKNTSQVVLNSCVHWFARNYNGVCCNFKRLIASFDLTSEKLGTLILPTCLQHLQDPEFRDCLLTFRESLCLAKITGSSCNIWVMKEYGITESWEMQFSIPILIANTPIRLIDYQDRSKLLLLYTKACKMFMYDTTTFEVDNICKRGQLRGDGIYRYTESLVLINCGKTLDRTHTENLTIKEPRLMKEQSENLTIKEPRLMKKQLENQTIKEIRTKKKQS